MGLYFLLEKEMATHPSVLAWRIPGTEEPGGLLSMGSHRVGHNWCDLAAAAARYLWDNIKCANLHYKGPRRIRERSTENIVEDIIAENFPK